MPKAIAGAHEGIREAARRLLASEGYENLTMRSIASESGIATGTLYNYYRAKDEIVYSLMKEDWDATLGRMDAAIGGSAELGAVGETAIKSALLRRIFNILHDFTSKYSSVWRIMAIVPSEKKSPALKDYQTSIFVEEIAGRIQAAIERSPPGPQGNALLPPLIARIFSIYAMDADPDYAALGYLLMKLLQP